MQDLRIFSAVQGQVRQGFDGSRLVQQLWVRGGVYRQVNRGVPQGGLGAPRRDARLAEVGTERGTQGVNVNRAALGVPLVG